MNTLPETPPWALRDWGAAAVNAIVGGPMVVVLNTLFEMEQEEKRACELWGQSASVAAWLSKKPSRRRAERIRKLWNLRRRDLKLKRGRAQKAYEKYKAEQGFED